MGTNSAVEQALRLGTNDLRGHEKVKCDVMLFVRALLQPTVVILRNIICTASDKINRIKVTCGKKLNTGPVIIFVEEWGVGVGEGKKVEIKPISDWPERGGLSAV